MSSAWPRLTAWRSASPWRADHCPDAVVDSTARRQVGAVRRRAAWRRVRCEAIRRGAGPGLVLVTLPLAGQLHDALAHAQAREAVLALVDGWPAWYTLEQGAAGGGLHAHIVAPAAAAATVQTRGGLEVHLARVLPEAGGVRGLASYLAKPRDARAAHSAHVRQVDPLSLYDAAEDYLEARARHYAATGSPRLPAASGLVNVPRRQVLAVPLAPGLVLACLAAVLEVQLATLQDVLASGAARPSTARPAGYPVPTLHQVEAASRYALRALRPRPHPPP